jgi:breast cancer 2 susceptibility protein
VKDAYKPTRGGDSGRKAQLTVWDILNLSIAEGSQAGEFKLGQKFLVSDGFFRGVEVSSNDYTR